MPSMVRKKRRSTAKKLLFALIATVIVLAAIEVGLRVAGFRYVPFLDAASFWDRFDTEMAGEPPFASDPVLFWRLKPNLYHDVSPETIDYTTTGPHGFRGKDYPFPLQKPAGMFRVICVGDSSTFGDQVRDGETFAMVLQDRLHKRFPDRAIDVVNAGVPGYTSHQVRKYIESELLALSPDVIVVMVGANDLVPAKGNIADKDRPQSSVRIAKIRKKIGGLRLYQLLSAVMVPLRHAPKAEELGKNPDGSDNIRIRVDYDDFVANLMAIKEMGDRAGYRTIMMTVPHTFENEHIMNPYTRRAAKQSGAVLLDLAKRMKVLQGQGLDLYQPDGGHPSVRGHAEIAAMLEEPIAKMIGQ